MLTLHLAPEIETHLRTLAHKQGIEPTIYAERLLMSILPDVSKSEEWRGVAQKLEQYNHTAENLNTEERLAAFREWVALPRRTLPTLSDEALLRESIYGDRG